MKGDFKVNTENSGSGSGVYVFLGVSFMLISIALMYLGYDRYMNTYQISKAGFICTKIEQIGKNMDDVRCVQYTDQKYSKEAIALSKTVDSYSK
jgi:hypothetical protein